MSKPLNSKDVRVKVVRTEDNDGNPVIFVSLKRPGYAWERTPATEGSVQAMQAHLPEAEFEFHSN